MNATTFGSGSAVAAVEGSGDGTPPTYSSDRCNFWLGILADSDADASDGISESEYFSFLSRIDEPPYVAAYLEGFADFDDLPWPLRLVHKSLACHCRRLGYGDGCCEGSDAELVLLGPTGGGDGSMDYKDLICQQVSFALERSVPVPRPTAGPSEAPTRIPPAGPPSASPATAGPTIPPSVSPVLPPGPTVSPTLSSGPTLRVADPLGKLVQSPDPDTGAEFDENEDGRMGAGAMAGIIVAVVVVFVLLIALVAYRRRRERIELRNFAGNQLPDSDLEVPWPDDEPMPKPPEPRRAPEEDDESSAPSVWSNADEAAGAMRGGDGLSRKMAGSSLAAMGAASTVAKTLMSSPPSERRVV